MSILEVKNHMLARVDEVVAAVSARRSPRYAESLKRTAFSMHALEGLERVAGATGLKPVASILTLEVTTLLLRGAVCGLHSTLDDDPRNVGFLSEYFEELTPVLKALLEADKAIRDKMKAP